MGFRDRNGERVQGIREMLERLKRERQERLEQHELGGVYDEIAQELREVVEMERVPRTTDVLGTYRVELTPEGELDGYERVHRYYRNQAEG